MATLSKRTIRRPPRPEPIPFGFIEVAGCPAPIFTFIQPLLGRILVSELLATASRRSLYSSCGANFGHRNRDEKIIIREMGRLSSRCPCDAEPDIVEGSSDRIPAAVCRAQVLRAKAPRTTAKHSKTAARGAARDGDRCVSAPLVIVLPAVLDPLPDITQHVIEPIRIGRKTAHRRRAFIVPLGPATVTQRVSASDLVTPPILRCRPATRCVFPLRLGQEPVTVSGLKRQPFDIGLRVFPSDLHHWVAVRFAKPGLRQDELSP